MNTGVLNLYKRVHGRITDSKLLLGSFWTIIGGGFSRITLVAGSILTAQVLGAEKYGEFGITRSTINMILILAGLNVGSVLTKYIAEFKEKDELKCKLLVTQNYLFVFVLSLIFTITIFFLAGFLSSNLLGAPQLEEEIKLSVLVIFFGITFPLNEAVFRGFGWFKQLGIVQVLGSLSFLILVPLGASYYGVYGAIWGYLIYTVVMTGLTSGKLFLKLRASKLTIFIFKKEIFNLTLLKKLTIPVFLASLIEAPFFWAAQVLLIKAEGMAENGIVNAILQIRAIALIIPGYISLVTLPLLSSSLSNPDRSQFKNYFKKTLKLNLGIAFICIIPLIIFPDFVMSFFGEDFKVGYWTSFWAYLGVPLLVVAGVLNQSLIAKNLGWINFFISISWNILFIGLVYFLVTINQTGSLGYMISMFAAITLLTALKFYFNQKENGNS